MKQRIQTAIIAMGIFIPLVLYGSWPFMILIYLIGTIAVIELINMRKMKLKFLPFLLATLMLWTILAPITGNIVLFPKSTFIVLFVMVLLALTVLTKNMFTFDDAGFILLSTIYISVGFYFLLVTRAEGLNYILFVLFVIWSTDTGAYFFGRFFGKRKLWPKISPNKTITGAVGGLVLACIVGMSFQLIHPFDHSIYIIIILSLAISVIGQMGDLIASAFKRHYQVKDSSNILPGHGGILDRFDSLLFVLPFLYIIQFIT